MKTENNRAARYLTQRIKATEADVAKFMAYAKSFGVTEAILLHGMGTIRAETTLEILTTGGELGSAELKDICESMLMGRRAMLSTCPPEHFKSQHDGVRDALEIINATMAIEAHANQ